MNNITNKVTWKELDCYADCFINVEGIITYGGKPRKKYIDKDGYELVHLKLNKNGKWVIRRVHRLVAEAFIHNPDKKPQVNHINGIKDDNRVNNLEWVTPKENIIHGYKNSLMNSHKRRGERKNTQGENHPKARLTEEEVKSMREKNAKDPKKFNSVKLSKMFGVSAGYVRLVLTRKRWNHI